MNQNDKILYLLSFDTSKTLCENRQNFITEQQKWYEKPGYEKYAPTEYEKGELKKIETFSHNLEKIGNIDAHDILFYSSLAAGFFGPWGMAVSLALDLGNAYLYHKEGDDFEAGLQIAFSLIPGGELATKIPIIKKYGKKFFENILLKSTKGGVMTKAEREAWEELTKESKWIKSRVTKEILKKSFTQIFKGFRLPDMIKFMWLFQKKYPKATFISRIVIEFGGVYYTWEKLAEIFGIKDKSKKNVELSSKIESEFNKNPNKYKEETVDAVTEGLFSIPQNERDSIASDYWNR